MNGHLRGARQLILRDPYVQLFWQARLFIELLLLIHELIPEGEETTIRLVTKSDSRNPEEQDENLRKVQDTFASSKVNVEFDYGNTDRFHARRITTDTGWKISLDRGLDIFQPYEINIFSLSASIQEERLTKAFELTYLRVPDTRNKCKRPAGCIG